ncbi:glycosyltransferase family 4 protein [Rosistilla oblonga]|uniref:glycosyltransferase family 4 protein n=1 Tax=Rosistilla oblonga TaxID=2527990 RepID=UPI003A986279
MKSKPYRILMLLENESVPDDCRVLLEAEALIDAGYAVTIICPTGEVTKKVDRIGEIRVYRYPQAWEMSGVLGYLLEYGYSLVAAFVLSWFVLLRHGFDAVHVHTPPDLMGLVAIFFKLLGKRFVFDHHDLSPELYLAQKPGRGEGTVYRALRFFERLSCRKADRLIATNDTQRSIQIDRCGADPEACYIVRNGPNALFLSDVQPLESIRTPGCLTIGYVGVIGVQDGVDFMVRALHEVKTKHGRDDFRGVIVGSGPAIADLKRLAAKLDLADKILFTGMIPFATVPSHIAAFDICLTPDPSNAYNDSCTTIKTMEYMALRKPTVCFRTRENQITAGDAAVYADNNDIPAYADAIVQLMDDPALRQAMGQTARQRIDNGLTWQHQAVRLIELYDNLFDVVRDPADCDAPAAVASVS